MYSNYVMKLERLMFLLMKLARKLLCVKIYFIQIQFTFILCIATWTADDYDSIVDVYTSAKRFYFQLRYIQ